VREATAAVQRVLPDADVVIHTVPRSTVAESLFDRCGVAARNNVLLHDVSIESFTTAACGAAHRSEGDDALLEAHRFVYGWSSRFARVTAGGFGADAYRKRTATIEAPVRIEQDRRIEERLRDAAANVPGVVDIHEISVDRVGERLHVTCTARSGRDGDAARA